MVVVVVVVVVVVDVVVVVVVVVEVDVVEVVVVVVGGAVLQLAGSGTDTGSRTVFVMVPSWVSKICEPVGVVSKNTIGDAALAPATVPCVEVFPVNRYWPEPLTVPVLTKSVPLVKAKASWV